MSESILHEKLEQRSPEWFALRKGRITCSELSNILTPAKLQLSKASESFALVKASERITGLTEPFVETWQIQRGIDNEPIAREYYEKATNTKVKEVGFYEYNKDFMFGYSPDGIVGNDGLIEIKCPSPMVHLDTLINKKIDPKYMLQMQGGMFASGREWCDFVSYSEGLALSIIRVHKDLEIIEKIENQLCQFETMIQTAMDAHHKAIENGSILTKKIKTL
jgi:putative phage-type endonuclease